MALWALAAVAVWMVPAAEDPGSAKATLHLDGKAMEQASVAMSRALILEDLEAARLALDALLAASPPLKPEDQEVFGRAIYDADRALHMTLTRAREFAALDNVTRAFDEYIWVQRTCLNCHGIAREEGRLPAQGPIRPAQP